MMSERRPSHQRHKLHLVAAILSAAAIVVLFGDLYVSARMFENVALARESFLYLALFIAIAAIIVGTMAVERQRHWEKKQRTITMLAMAAAIFIVAAAIVVLGARACSGPPIVY
jgi:surface polysaccharide O-acyltransferase-like enzyme